MSEKRVGPLVIVTERCEGCVHLQSEYFCVEDGNDVDSGFTHRCGHFTRPRHIGSYSDKTPDWCPCRGGTTRGSR